jgi:hypothetical protein
MHSSPTDNKFMGMMDYVLESFYNLVTGDSKDPSDSGSSSGSHDPSRECFHVGTPEGHVAEIPEDRDAP